MNRNTQIQEAQNKVIGSLLFQPDCPLTTTVTRGRVEDGLTCQITQGRFTAVADLGPGMGGEAAGPSPSFYGRAGIVGCVAIAVKMTAAREGLDFRRVDVAVETDFDDGALFGLGNRGAAPLETRVKIDIDTDVDRSTVDALVQRVLEMDPWYLALRDAQQVLVELQTNAAAVP